MPAHAARRATERSILVGDLNVAPLEHDVWSHKQLLKVVSHTPIECEKLIAAQKAGNWIDVARTLRAASRRSSTPGGAIARPTGPPPTTAAGSITSGCRRRSATGSPTIKIAKDARGWERPSDHVPVTATLEV